MILIKNAQIVTDNNIKRASLLIEDEWIKEIFDAESPLPTNDDIEIIDAEGLLLLPGVIDDQVHFREPGLTHKGTIHSESRAAVAGGVTSFMEMPNTNPQTTTVKTLEDKFRLAQEQAMANYSFYIGATNDNIEELKQIDTSKVCGVKVFMGSSTGNMLVNDEKVLQRIFSEIKCLIATHCEDEATIQANTAHYKRLFGENLDTIYHSKIRSKEACYLSSSYAVRLAQENDTRLHILHISTAKELSLFRNDIPLKEKKITAEVCVHHLWFSDVDYTDKGNLIKWNPAIKTARDQQALIHAVKDDLLDVIATDHAPHTIEEKSGNIFQASSGGPLVQHSLLAMLQMVKRGIFSLEKVVDKMCHKPADLFRIDRRGYIREGYYADLVLVNPKQTTKVEKNNILYQCQWSPFEGEQFDNIIEKTIINGKIVYDNGKFDEDFRGKRLEFNLF